MTDEQPLVDEVPLEDRLKALLANISGYIELYHGGSVEYVALGDDNVLKVRLGGACDGCALSTTTLKGWVGGTVRQFFPEIEEVVSVES